MGKHQIAMVGLAVMGANLARNLASKGFSVAVYNRSESVTREFSEKYSENLTPYYSIKELVSSLERPRKILIMVKAGSPVDAVIDSLIAYLEPDDIVVDCGNSFYKDTIRRESSLRASGIHFVGCGVSGGEEGALNGPSIMPGGSEAAYQALAPYLTKIAARDFSGNPCVAHIGSDGSGHFVKMVHNGIEYAVMQMIAESYEVFRKVYMLPAGEIGDIFREYNQGVLDSYLIEITANVLKKMDDSGVPIIDRIVDRAGAKGTGLWTSVDALESAMSVSSIVEATFARMISAKKDLRKKLGAKFEFAHEVILPLDEMRQKLEYTLYLGLLFAYAQGLALIREQSETNHWSIDLAEITRIWQGGCIIRSQILAFLTEAYGSKKDVEHIFELPQIQQVIHENLRGYQDVLSALIRSNIATPALSSALEYFYQIVTIDSSANMIQGLRDYFGAHTYERVDMEGVFHTQWTN